MPSSLERSRSFAADAIARVRSAFERGVGREPGPEIPVEPFGAHNVTTPAALVKLGTSIASARRARANYEQANQTAELLREKERAEIARIRAETDWFGRRQSATGSSRPPGYWDRMAAVAEENARTRSRNAGTRDTLGRQVTASRAAIGEIDKELERETASTLSRELGVVDRYFQSLVGRLNSGSAEARALALREAGIDPVEFDHPDATPAIRAQMIAKAKEGMRDLVTRRTTSEVQARAGRRRRPYQDVFDRASGVIQDMDAEAAAAPRELDPEDPLQMYEEEPQ